MNLRALTPVLCALTSAVLVLLSFTGPMARSCPGGDFTMPSKELFSRHDPGHGMCFRAVRINLVASGFALVAAVLCLIDHGWEAYQRGLEQGRKGGGA